jgi:hypothetical protein
VFFSFPPSPPSRFSLLLFSYFLLASPPLAVVSAFAEITHAFPIPIDSNPSEIEAYQKESLRTLSRVNVDNNSVGLYHTSSKDYLRPETTANQYEYQKAIPNRFVSLFFFPSFFRRDNKSRYDE